VWRLSQSREQPQQLPIHNSLKVMLKSVKRECGGQGAEYNAELWKKALLYYRIHKNWRCHPADRSILETFPDYYAWWRPLTKMGNAARTAALAADAAAVSSADVAVDDAGGGGCCCRQGRRRRRRRPCSPGLHRCPFHQRRNGCLLGSGATSIVRSYRT
jgi:hypothetical protein